MNILQTRDASFQYENGRTIFQNANISLEEGQILTVLGPNGAGKSTLLHCLMGFSSLTQGDVLLRGKPIGTYPRRAVARELGFLPQQLTAAFAYTVLEYVIMGRAVTPDLRRNRSYTQGRTFRLYPSDKKHRHSCTKPLAILLNMQYNSAEANKEPDTGDNSPPYLMQELQVPAGGRVIFIPRIGPSLPYGECRGGTCVNRIGAVGRCFSPLVFCSLQPELPLGAAPCCPLMGHCGGAAYKLFHTCFIGRESP